MDEGEGVNDGPPLFSFVTILEEDGVTTSATTELELLLGELELPLGVDVLNHKLLLDGDGTYTFLGGGTQAVSLLLVFLLLLLLLLPFIFLTGISNNKQPTS